MTRMDQKLENIRAGRYTRSDFMIADAKDGDMGSGVRMAGPKRRADGSHEGFRTRREYLDSIREIINQDIVDIMLVSASNLEVLDEEGAFSGSSIQPAIRANEATDIWGGLRHATYTGQRSRPHRSAILSQAIEGWSESTHRRSGANLGLYSMTFNNNLDDDLATLEAFKEFRSEARSIGFRYFLEVFNPNAPQGLSGKDVGEFINDNIVRSLAGVRKLDRPLFLKIPFNGPRALEELASYDPSVVVGVLGGGAGTTRDTFELVHQAEKHGARLALFGRKINSADSPRRIVALMRQVADGTIRPDEAVRAYHDALREEQVIPSRSLEDDLRITEAPLKH